MPLARAHFVRHAETLFNVNGQLQGWCDSPLTERGERQALALGKRLTRERLAAAFTSDLTRTRTTAKAALSGHPSLVPVELGALREWHFGGWEGQPNASLWEPVFQDHGYTYRPASPDWTLMTTNGFDTVIDAIHRLDGTGRAETSQQVNLRLNAALQAIVQAAHHAAEADAGDVLVVTHGVVLGTLLRLLRPDHIQPAGFPNCGILTVTWQEDDVILSDVDASCALVNESVAGPQLNGLTSATDSFRD